MAVGDLCPNTHTGNRVHYVINSNTELCIECDNKRARHEAALREFWEELGYEA